MISIIVPIYNVEKYLCKCLDSIIGQTYNDLQIILINDGSTDNSLSICEKYKNLDNRIELINKENTGASDTRNVGIKNAKGKYIMFVDSDDWLERDMCEKLLENAERNSADLVFCSYVNECSYGSVNKTIYNEDIICYDESNIKEEYITPIMGLVGNRLKHPDKLDALVPIWGRLYSSYVIHNYNLRFIDLDTIPSECQQFNLEYSIHINKVVYIRQYLYHYRRNNGVSVTKGYRKNLLEKWKYWYKYNNELITENQLDYLWDAYYSRMAFSVIPLGGNAIKLECVSDALLEIKTFLNECNYEDVYSKLNFKYFPIYWKVFFAMAKQKNVFGFYCITKVMRMILNYRKK